MAQSFLCIPKPIIRKLQQAVDSGKINVDKLVKMTSDERTRVLEKYVGKSYVENINKRFVTKFNLELSDEAMKDVLDTMAKVNSLKAKSPIKTTDDWQNMKEPPEWAKEYVALNNRMQGVVDPISKMKLIPSIKATLGKEVQKIKDAETLFDKGLATGKLIGNAITSPVYKSLKASMDASFALRQGFKIFTKSPKEWGKGMAEAFKIFKAVGSKDKMDAIMDTFKATYLAHPHYEKLINEGKVAFGVVEEFFPTTFAEKAPLLGNLFKSSNDAFSVFSQSARFGIANDLLEKQMKLLKGADLSKEQLNAIGKVANSITGRGSLGKLEPMSDWANKLFFSARYVKSAFDTFTMPFNSKLTPFARTEALKHSLVTLSSIGALMTTASFFGDVEFDPRSSKFGKMKLPGSDTWIDLTAGLGSYITLAAKQATGEVKTSKGKISELNTGDYGSTSRFDVLTDWASNKLAPMPSMIKQAFLEGELYGGKEPNIENITRELFMPITADNIIDNLQNEEKAVALLGILDGLGVGVTTPR